MNAAKHVAMLERRLHYLTGLPKPNVMVINEQNALRWALPMLRAVADKEAQRPRLGEACPACSTAPGFVCAHLPRRT